ncbi:transcription-repair coupling factor [Oenococcus alcoholitolerans]|uniref:transcription-repair coupling factor n=1 Tax=Oenococcus alcoholitolerans TaxID=931074 RepID=UPI003F6E8D55
MQPLTDFQSKTKFIDQLIEMQDKKAASVLITGLNDNPKPLIVAALFEQLKKEGKHKNLLLITDTEFRADQLTNNLASLIDENDVYQIRAEESLATETAVVSKDSDLSRVLALRALQSERQVLIIAPLSALLRYYPRPDIFKQAVFTVAVGKNYTYEDLSRKLVEMGYHKTAVTANPGEFSVRGEIFDLYPINRSDPLRLDFFDDQLESIRTFDSDSQKSLKKIDHADVMPISDFILPSFQFSSAAERLKRAFLDYRDSLKGADKKKITTFFQPLLQDPAKSAAAHQLAPFTQFFLDRNLFDYLQKDDLILIDDFARIKDQQKIQEEKNAQWMAEKLADFKMLPDQHPQIDAVSLLRKLKIDRESKQLSFKNPRIFLSNLKRSLNDLRFSDSIDLLTRPMQKYFGQMPVLKADIESFSKRGFTVVLTAFNQERLLSLQRTLHDFKMNYAITDHVLLGTVQLQQGSLVNGFELPFEKLAVITESELFAKAHKKVIHHQTFSNAERITSYSQLKAGDFVVHVNHGIGRFQGLVTLEANGGRQDYLSIAYAQNAKIFVPVTHLDLVQKYIGAADGSPKINSLNSTEWAKTKHRVATKVEDIADDLIDLYAQREGEVGFAFSPDDERQRHFDDNFPYPETVDQLRSIKEIKEDMESKRPMDRLLVGDVGFGKTEVALRAAFKAIENHKQVAFLTPTTILAQQHYQTALERFSDFPEVQIAMLSRFNTPSQNKAVIKKLKDHQIDMVIGTHRLLSKDVSFDDLGFLIIDEEQRFGVKHKEKIKQMRADIDVLTLTATPIPRTLNMALVGARDLSVLETPPANRFPIQTYVIEENWPVVADAIEREMSRGGQTFFLHNRVQDIERTVAEVQRIVPEANVGYIHGQMTETQLENVLSDFLDGTYDVLVTTTIIETGVDIPNANTLIVEDSQRFGLSQLYQLRGRIGRSNRLAYAYFTYPGDRQPTEEAQKRLEAIRDFTELGSGFKLAMRDLSIRGAGDILGKQQHGFIDSVGYELYQQMLKDAVSARKNKEKPYPRSNAEVVSDLQALIPEKYISDGSLKIEMYQRIRKSLTDKQVDESRQELVDRFGPIPDEVDNLFTLVALKNASDLAKVENIHVDKKTAVLVFDQKASAILGGELIFKTLQALKEKARVNALDKKLQLKIIFSGDNETKNIEETTNYLKTVYKELKSAIR